MDDTEGISIECLGDELYSRTMALVSFLVALDPPVSTPAGKLLSSLADAVQEYEISTFGFFGDKKE